MSHSVEPEMGHVRYEWRYGGQWCALDTAFRGEAGLPAESSLEAFLVEHYWGYTARRGGGSTEYGVEHPPWKVWPGTAASLQCDVGSVYGREFVAPLSGSLATAFVANLGYHGAQGCSSDLKGGVARFQEPFRSAAAAKRVFRRASSGQWPAGQPSRSLEAQQRRLPVQHNDGLRS